MAKYTNRQKLSQKEEGELIIEFCNALLALSKVEEAVLFLKDLLSKAEIRMIAKRLKIAQLLLEGETYEEIAKQLKTSQNTIARVNMWLGQSGEGFRLALSKRKELKEIEKPTWTGIKRRYPMYYWPEILLKEVIYSANKRQRERLQKVIENIDEKDQFLKEINQYLKQNYDTS